MKKATSILATLAVSLFCVNATAQTVEKESYLFNHWSVGLGILEDFHIQAAGTILPNLQVRLVYSTLHPYLGIASAILKNDPNVGSITPFTKTIPINAKVSEDVTIDNLDVVASIHSRELNLLVDFFPSEMSNLHLTGGIVIDLTPDLVKASLTAVSNTGNPVLKPAADGSGLISFGGISPDPNGTINVGVGYGLRTIRPYLGIGFGRPVSVDKRVSVNFDLGIVYTGGIRVRSEGYADSVATPAWPTAKPVELNEEWMNTTKLPGGNKTITETVGASTVEYLGMANSLPILPYLRLTVACRLF